MALFFGGFIFLFLLIFKPFELDTVPLQRLLLISGLYGLITFGCIFFTSVVVPLLIPGYFCEEEWTTARQILHIAFVLILVGLVNFLVSPWFVHTTLTFRDAIWHQGVTLIMGLLPISIFILIRQNQLLKTFREKAKTLEKKLKEKNELQQQVKEEEKKTADIIVMEGDYQNERVSVPPHQLYMVQSANNYVKVYVEQKGKVAYSIILLTMKKAEESLSVNSAFFRCHRTCIINLDKIIHVEGNAQGYRITLEGIEEPVPISRNFSAEFSDRLLAMRRDSE
jgi:DNA-binding LytR/AlgR family response regulator